MAIAPYRYPTIRRRTTQGALFADLHHGRPTRLRVRLHLVRPLVQRAREQVVRLGTGAGGAAGPGGQRQPLVAYSGLAEGVSRWRAMR